MKKDKKNLSHIYLMNDVGLSLIDPENVNVMNCIPKKSNLLLLMLVPLEFYMVTLL